MFTAKSGSLGGGSVDAGMAGVPVGRALVGQQAHAQGRGVEDADPSGVQAAGARCQALILQRVGAVGHDGIDALGQGDVLQQAQIIAGDPYATDDALGLEFAHQG